MLWRATTQIVKVRVRSESAVHEGPGEPVDSILFRCHGARHDLSVEWIVQVVSQARLDRKWLLNELNELVLPRRVTHQQELGSQFLSIMAGESSVC